MVASAFHYVDLVFEHLLTMADERGLSDLRRHVEGLSDVGARLRCAQAIDAILTEDLANAHQAGERGEDIEKRALPQWRTVTAETYDGQREALSDGKKNPQRTKTEASGRSQKRTSQRRR